MQFVSCFFIYNTRKAIGTKITIMGRGDKKTKKGKTFKGSFGKTRTSKTSKKQVPAKKDS